MNAPRYTHESCTVELHEYLSFILRGAAKQKGKVLSLVDTVRVFRRDVAKQPTAAPGRLPC